METEIAELENEKSLLEEQINSGECSSDELLEKSSRIGEVLRLIEDKELRWLELSEYEMK